LKKMVTLPIVAQMDMPLNSRGDSMSMGETVLRLTALPTFDTNMKKWQPLSGEVDRLQTPGDISPSPVPVAPGNGVEVHPVPGIGGSGDDTGSSGAN
jgi:defect in organelle trafficking protein DotC